MNTNKNVKNGKNVNKKNTYLDFLKIQGNPLFNIYLKYFEQYLGKKHYRISEKNQALVLDHLERLREQIDDEDFERIVVYHFENLPKSNNGSIVAFIHAYQRYLKKLLEGEL